MSALLIFILVTLLKSAWAQEEDNVGLHIVGGMDAAEGEFPFMVAITKNGNQECGGTIINPSWVLTAAHCVVGVKLSHLRILYGSTNKDSMKAVEVGISVRHTEYNKEEKTHDIALVKVRSEFENIKAVELPAYLQDVPGETSAIAIGWGTLEHKGPYSKILQKVDLRVLSESECENMVQPFYSHNMCTGKSSERNDVCKADSGGPLLVGGKQFGIVSWGYPPCAGYVTVFTKVSHHTKWIADVLEHN